MLNKKVVEVYVQPFVVGARLLESLGATFGRELGDVLGFAQQLVEPRLNVVDSAKRFIDRCAELVLNIARNFMRGELCIVVRLDVSDACERVS